MFLHAFRKVLNDFFPLLSRRQSIYLNNHIFNQWCRISEFTALCTQIRICFIVFISTIQILLRFLPTLLFGRALGAQNI